MFPREDLGEGPGVPAARASRWTCFEQAAPVSLRLGFRIGVVVVTGVGPWWTGVGRSWRILAAAERATVIARLEEGVAADLIEVVKLVAAWVVFDEDAIVDRLQDPAS